MDLDAEPGAERAAEAERRADVAEEAARDAAKRAARAEQRAEQRAARGGGGGRRQARAVGSAGRALRRPRGRGGDRPAGLAGARRPPDAARVRARSRQSRPGAGAIDSVLARAAVSHGCQRKPRCSADAVRRSAVDSCGGTLNASPRMRHKSFILVAVVLAGPARRRGRRFRVRQLARRHDRRGRDVAGVDVGGMKSRRGPPASSRRELQEPLERPIAVRARRASASRSRPQDAGVQADVDGMVDEALEASRERQHLHPRGARPHGRRGERPGPGAGDVLDRGGRAARQARGRRS